MFGLIVPPAALLIDFGPLSSGSEDDVSDRHKHANLNHEEGDVVSDVLWFQGSYDINSENAKQIRSTSQPRTKKKHTGPPSQTYGHIIAERRRREQLGRLFIALSAIVPGVKKKRVETLEGKAAKRTMEPVVHVKKSKILVEDEGSSDEKSGSSREQVQEPEIEARVVNNQILLRVHCGKQKGTLANLLSKVESLNLVVVNTSVTTFGSSAQDITIIAEMEKEFNMTVKEVASVLRASLQ
ncbi:Transcription factor [Sesamum angolense]|uniref:Transcription factor n=1 Tax=Sesamum angolense TaxID=2727404 RepID=A0AAE2BQ12_9LAMI|nr:Transcription factor [Sesamum angolense]